MTVLGICAICHKPIVEKRTSPSDAFPRGESYMGHLVRDRVPSIGTHEPQIATRSVSMFQVQAAS